MENFKNPLSLTEDVDPVTEMGKSIDSLLGEGNWSGDNPFTIDIADIKSGVGYRYEVRKTEDSIIIQERLTDNPRLVRTYLLRRKDDQWEYLDSYEEEGLGSSLPRLQEAYGRLQIAIEGLTDKLKGGSSEAEIRKVIDELPADERRRFLRLAVFPLPPYTFDREAAEYVMEVDSPQYIDLYVDKGLLNEKDGRYNLSEGVHAIADELISD